MLYISLVAHDRRWRSASCSRVRLRAKQLAPVCQAEHRTRLRPPGLNGSPCQPSDGGRVRLSFTSIERGPCRRYFEPFVPMRPIRSTRRAAHRETCRVQAAPAEVAARSPRDWKRRLNIFAEAGTKSRNSNERSTPSTAGSSTGSRGSLPGLVDLPQPPRASPCAAGAVLAWLFATSIKVEYALLLQLSCVPPPRTGSFRGSCWRSPETPP